MWPIISKYKLSSSPIYPTMHTSLHEEKQIIALCRAHQNPTIAHLNLPKLIISLPRTTSVLCKDWKHWYATRRFLCNDRGTMWKKWVGCHAQEDSEHLHPITLKTIIGQTIYWWASHCNPIIINLFFVLLCWSSML